MTIKVTFLSMILLLSWPVVAQTIGISDFLGHWQYEYSQDSVNEQWSNYNERDLQILMEEDAVFQKNEESDNSEPGLPASNAPLLLKDALLTMKVFPDIHSSEMVRFSFLQMPRGGEDFLYIDRSKGDLKGEIVIEESNTFLFLTNLGQTEEYKILSVSKTNMVLLDAVNNTKHLFKRKQ